MSGSLFSRKLSVKGWCFYRVTSRKPQAVNMHETVQRCSLKCHDSEPAVKLNTSLLQISKWLHPTSQHCSQSYLDLLVTSSRSTVLRWDFFQSCRLLICVFCGLWEKQLWHWSHTQCKWIALIWFYLNITIWKRLSGYICIVNIILVTMQKSSADLIVSSVADLHPPVTSDTGSPLL